MESRPVADAIVAPYMVHVQHRGAVDWNGRGHHDVHPRIGINAAGHDVVPGTRHHPARKHRSPASDDSQRARRNEVRNFFSCSVPGEFWSERSKRGSDAARDRCLRMVRDSDLDRRTGTRHLAQGCMVRLGQHRIIYGDLVWNFLAHSGPHHSERNRRHQGSGELVGSAPPWWRARVVVLGRQERRWTAEHTFAIGEASTGLDTVLDAVPRRAYS